MLWARLHAALKIADCAPAQARPRYRCGLRAKINLAADGAWARQLAALRSEVSVPGRYAACRGHGWRLPVKPDSTPAIRQRPKRRSTRWGVPTRRADLNEATLHVWSDLQRVLERESSTLLAALRQTTASGASVGHHSMRRCDLPPTSSEPNRPHSLPRLPTSPDPTATRSGRESWPPANRRRGVGGSICSLRPPPRRVVTRGMRTDGLPLVAAKTRLLPGNDSRHACGPGHRRWPQLWSGHRRRGGAWSVIGTK